MRPTSLTHWGAFTADVHDPATSPRSRRCPATPTRRPCWATCPARFGIDPGSPPRPSGAAGCETAPAPRTVRGADEFVAVSWDELTELLAGELRRVVDTHGNEAIYGGSYGWASAGRFHHAQSQVHRFLKLLGGYTFSRHSYSLGATGVIMPRVVGTHDDLFKRSTEWKVIVEHTELLVCFGGVALKNTGINHGGTTAHPARDALHRFRDTRRATRVVQPAARRRRRRLRMVCAGAGHRRGDHAGAGARAGHRITRRPRFPRHATAPATTASSATCSAPTTACRSRRSGPPTICGLPPTTSSRWRGGWRRPHDRHRQLVAAADAARRAGAVDGADAGGDARPDRPSRRRFRPRLRVDERAGAAAAALPAAVTPAGRQPGQTFIPVAAVSDMLLHPGEPFDYNGRTADLSRHQAASTGPAAIRSTTTRTLPRLRRALAASTPSWCTTRTGRRWPSTPTSSCRRPPRSNATTTPVRATTRC